MKAFYRLGVAFVLSCCMACTAPATSTSDKAHMQQLLTNLSNSEVLWDGNTLGLWPTMVGENAKGLHALGTDAIPGLLPALANPEKFVAAHVLLTQITGVEYSTFPAWNGLRVNITADSMVTIDPAQQPMLQQRWEQWAQTRPRPTRLPEITP